MKNTREGGNVQVGGCGDRRRKRACEFLVREGRCGEEEAP